MTYPDWKLQGFLSVPLLLVLAFVLNATCCSIVKLCLSLWDPCGLQHTRLPCPSLFPGVCSNSCPLSQWCHPTISSSVTSFSSCPQSFPALGSLPIRIFTIRVFASLHQVAKILGLQVQHQSLQKIFRVDFLYDWVVWSPCCPRDSEEPSLAPQFELTYYLNYIQSTLEN